MESVPNSALMALLQAAQKAAEKTKPKALSIPEFGELHVAAMSSEEWLTMGEDADLSPSEQKGWSVARWLCDASGRRIVSRSDKDVLAQFAKIPWQISSQILVAAGVLEEAPAGGSKNG